MQQNSHDSQSENKLVVMRVSNIFLTLSHYLVKLISIIFNNFLIEAIKIILSVLRIMLIILKNIKCRLHIIYIKPWLYCFL